MKKLLFFFFIALLSLVGYSANITWTNGNGTGVWNDAGNWSAGIPGPSDYAIFNATSTDDCLIDISIDVRGFTLQTGYTGNVTQGSGNSITVRDQDISLADGVFSGGDAFIDMINGNFQIRGGKFISTSDTLFLDINFIVSDSGLFYHNNGTVVFNDAGGRNINLRSRDTLFNMLVEPLSNNATLDLNGADTLTIVNKLVLNEGRMRGGPIELLDSLVLNSNYDQGNSQLWMKGNGNSVILANAGVGSHPYFVDMENTTDTLFVINQLGPIINWGDENDQLTILSGALKLSEAADLDFNEIEISSTGILVASIGETSFQGSWDNQGGTFNANQGTWVWDMNGDRSYRSTVVDTFFNLVYNPNADNRRLNLLADDSIYVQNRLELREGRIQTGNLQIEDSAYLYSGYDNGSADLWFVGPNTSRFFIESAEGSFNLFIRKDNPTDSVYFQTIVGSLLNIGETNRDLILQEGVLSLGLVDSVDLDFADIIIQDGGKLVASPEVTSYQGAWDNQGGSFNANQGTWLWDMNGDRNYRSTEVDTFFNLVYNPNADNRRLNLLADDSIYVQNRLELREGRIQVGHLLIEDTAYLFSDYDNGNADLWFIGSTTSNFIIESAEGSFNKYIRKTNSTDTVFYEALSGNSLNIGETDRDLIIQEGVLSFDMVDTVDLDYGDLVILDGSELQASPGITYYQGSWDNIGGRFNANQGTWIWDNPGNRGYATTEVDTFFTLLYQPPSNNAALVLQSADSIYIQNRIDLLEGRILSGNLLVNDTAYLYANYDDGSANIWFVGSTTSNFFIEDAVGDIDFYIRKMNSIDTVFFQPFVGNSFNLGENNRDLTIQKGVLSFDLVDTVDLDFGDLIIHAGAQLQASSGVISYQGDWDNQGGLFNANAGNWIWDNAGNRNYRSAVVDTFFNFNFSPASNNAALSIQPNDSIYIANKLEFTEGRVLTGHLLVADTAILYSNYDDGTADLWFIGSITSNFFIESAEGNFDKFIRKEHSTDTVFYQPLNGNSLAIGRTDRDLTIQEGVLSFALVDTVDLIYGDLNIEPGAQLQASSGIMSYQGNWDNQGGLFNANGGNWIWDNSANRNYRSTEVDTFFNFQYAPTSGNAALSSLFNDSIYIRNKLELTEGRILNGHLLAEDTAILYSTYDDGTADIWFVGSTPSNFIIESAEGNFDKFIRKDSPSDTVYFQPLIGTSLNIGETDRDLTIQEGVLSFAFVDQANLDYSDINIQAGASILATSGVTRYQGSWNNIAGGFNHNEGTWIFDLGGDRNFTSHQTDTFFRMIFNPPSGNSDLFITAGDEFTVEQALFLEQSGIINGTIRLLDTLEINAGYDNNGNADLYFEGSTDGTFLCNNTNVDHDIFINKSSANHRVEVLDENGGALNFGLANQNLSLLEGRLEFPANDPVNTSFANTLLSLGSVYQAPMGTIVFNGDWDNNQGKLEANDGTFIFQPTANRNYATTEVDTFFNFTYSANGNRFTNMGAGDTIRVMNDLNLVNGRIRDGVLSAAGDVLVSNTYDGDNLQADLQFVGPNPQAFEVSSGAAVMDGDIIIDKSIAEDITLNSEIDIDRGGQSITFNKGYLLSTQTNLLFIDGAHNMIGANDSSFVKGPVTKRGNQNFSFPLGDTVYAPITISNITSGAAQFRAEYIRKDPSDDSYDASLLDLGLNNVSIIEYWQLDRLVSGASCRVNLSWRPTSAVNVPAELTVARWNSSTLEWEDAGTTAFTGDPNNGTVTSASVGNFSPFALASTSINNPLPVTYKYFEASAGPYSNLLEWVTLSEINADYFLVQRSTDGLEWTEVGSVSANGNSTSEIKYQLTDLNVDESVLYYRLKQVDFDGAYEYSEIRVIDRESKVNPEVHIYPNPVRRDGTATISLSNFSDSRPLVSLISMQGLKVFQRQLNLSPSHKFDVDLSTLTKGTYIIRVESSGETMIRKLIVL